MRKKIAHRLIGLLLLAFCAGTWAWMLGWLVRPFPPGSLDNAPMLKAWMEPGVLGFPALVSIIAGVVGLLLLVGARSLRRMTMIRPLTKTTEKNDENRRTRS